MSFGFDLKLYVPLLKNKNIALNIDVVSRQAVTVLKNSVLDDQL